ncbi:MAG: RidA family protein [Verrucomicrobia bacterium]|nr:RidA family protein [Verrucomicrobiota bacterium]
MVRKNISSGSPYEDKIGFSRAVKIGNILAISGTAPIIEGKLPHDAYEQTKICLTIIKKAVEEAGASLENVIRTRVFLLDIKRWEEAARAHGEFFSKIKPACTFVQVSAFIKPEWLVEIEADCVLTV